MRTKRHRAAGLFFPFDGPVRTKFKSAAAAPPAPDPTKTIAAQTQSNIQTADANRTNAVTPTGSSNWTMGPDGRWTQTSSLTPTGQRVLSGTQDVAANLIPTAENLAGQAGTATTKPLDFSGVNQDYLNAGPTSLNQNATSAAYNAQKGFLDPQWTQNQTNIQDQLSRQGIPVGSEAYNNAMTNFNNSKTQAYSNAANTAVGQGQTGANNMFNMALLGQQQNIGQQQTAQQNPLKLLSQLYGQA